MNKIKWLNQTALLLDTTARKRESGCCDKGEWIKMTDEKARAIAECMRAIAKELVADDDTA